MLANLSPSSVSLDFLDGYLFRLIQQIANEQGFDASGLLIYYSARLEYRMGGLTDSEMDLARYLLRLKLKKIVHAGIGIGTLSCALACNGTAVIGVEGEKKRAALAKLIRAAVAEVWPEIRYDVVLGLFPEALAGQAYGDSTLIFTNVGSGWTDAVLDRVIGSMASFAEAFLDLRLFGWVREDEAERVALFNRIAKSARWAERLPHVSEGIHLAHFVFAPGGTPEPSSTGV